MGRFLVETCNSGSDSLVKISSKREVFYFGLFIRIFTIFVDLKSYLLDFSFYCNPLDTRLHDK
jgi:hypothetical protein